MCGILGLIARDGLAIDGRQLQSALQSIRHRGPDDEGYLLYDPTRREALAVGGPDTVPELALPPVAAAEPRRYRCAFGHRRLSIIDLTAAGHQPMRTADGRYWVTYNGEIYNYLELRQELELRGARFATASDTEVLLEAYRAWGVAMLPRLVGMFAFALLDTHENTVLLARDQFGIKPLYMVRSAGQVAFASEVKALLRLPGVRAVGNPAKVYQYLRYGQRDAEAATVLQSVERLPAAHYAVVHLDSLRCDGPRRYWEVDLSRRIAPSFDEAVAEVRGLFESAVRLHLRSDVPVGCTLSGGLDSSAIVRQVQALLGAGRPVATFSFVSNLEAEMNEEPYIDLITDTVVHKVRPQAPDIAADIDELMRALELPFESLSMYAQFRVFRLVRDAGIKVVLDGQGSDEIFGGYYSLIGARITGLLAQLRLLAAARSLAGAPRNARAFRARMVATAAGRLLPQSLQQTVAGLFGEPAYPGWLRADWFERRGVTPRLRAHGRGRDALREELRLGIEHLTLPELLRYEDGNSMHHSIESRVPFCVPQLAEYALALPDEYLVSPRGETKCVFRAAVADMLPAQIVRREKIGFAVPERIWLRELRQWLETAPTGALPFLEPREVRREMDAALAADGRWPPHVWRLVNLAFWARAFEVEWT
jgi:asparagine synthase (glutamine-hydrolysing)